MEEKKLQVVIRVRPLNSKEAAIAGAYSESAESQPNAHAVGNWVINKTSVQQVHRSYTFDRVFHPDDQTEAVYSHLAKPILDGVVEGIHGTIFAYGQTSSGKTHTMQGTARDVGVIPLCVRDLFRHIEARPDREFLIRASYVEIYNEVVRDLLNPTATNLKIHESHQRGVYVGGLTEEVVTSAPQLLRLMAKGADGRKVGATNLNEQSSRSHTIFRIMVESRARGGSGTDDSVESLDSVEDGTGAVIASALSLVDLAGSERAKSTGTSGLRLKEGSAINKSLLALSSVIKKLSDGAGGHVPYRDSKLTRILQPALGGNSNTGIICAMTPAPQHTEESHSTLQFASRAKQIANKPVVNEVVDDQTMLRRLKVEMSTLRRQLGALNSGDLPQQLEAVRGEQLKAEATVAEQQERIDRLTKLILVSSRNAHQGRSTSTSTDFDSSVEEDLEPEEAITMPLQAVRLDDDHTEGSSRRLSLSLHEFGATVVDETPAPPPPSAFDRERLDYFKQKTRDLSEEVAQTSQVRESLTAEIAQLRQEKLHLEALSEEHAATLAQTVRESGARERELYTVLGAKDITILAAQSDLGATRDALNDAIALSRDLQREVVQRSRAEQLKLEEQAAVIAGHEESARIASETQLAVTHALAALFSGVREGGVIPTDAFPQSEEFSTMESALKAHQSLVEVLVNALKEKTSTADEQTTHIGSLRMELDQLRAHSAAEARRGSIAGVDAKIKVAERDLAAKATQYQRLEEKFEELRGKHRSATDESAKHRSAMVTAQQEAVRLRKRVDELERGDTRKEKRAQQQMEKEMAIPLRKANDELAAVQKERDAAVGRDQANQQELSRLQESVGEIQARLDDAINEAAGVRAELDEALAREAQLTTELSEVSSTLEDVGALQEQVESLEEALCDASTKVQLAEDELAAESRSHRSAVEQCTHLQEELGKLRSQLSALELERVSQLESASSLEDAVEASRGELAQAKDREAALLERADLLAEQLDTQAEKISEACEDVRIAHEKSEEWRGRLETAKVESEERISELEAGWREERARLKAEIDQAVSEGLLRTKEAEQNLATLRKQVESNQESQGENEKLRTLLQAELQASQDRCEEMEEDIKQFKSLKRRLIREHKKALAQSEEELLAQVQELTVAKAERDELKAEVDSVRAERDERAAEVERLEHLKQTLGEKVKAEIASLKRENAKLQGYSAPRTDQENLATN